MKNAEICNVKCSADSLSQAQANICFKLNCNRDNFKTYNTVPFSYELIQQLFNPGNPHSIYLCNRVRSNFQSEPSPLCYIRADNHTRESLCTLKIAIVYGECCIHTCLAYRSFIYLNRIIPMSMSQLRRFVSKFEVHCFLLRHFARKVLFRSKKGVFSLLYLVLVLANWMIYNTQKLMSISKLKQSRKIMGENVIQTGKKIHNAFLNTIISPFPLYLPWSITNIPTVQTNGKSMIEDLP